MHASEWSLFRFLTTGLELHSEFWWAANKTMRGKQKWTANELLGCQADIFPLQNFKASGDAEDNGLKPLSFWILFQNMTDRFSFVCFWKVHKSSQLSFIFFKQWWVRSYSMLPRKGRTRNKNVPMSYCG